jgi:peptidoglycan/xylan/chitin deacetylase (PgdA/CDA1 family)
VPDPHASHAALERLARALGITPDTLNLASRRFSYMGVADLRQAAGRGCHIELHGHAHLYVKGQPEKNRLDIEACRQHISKAGLPMPRHYCYPSGAYDANAADLLASMNVLTATTCEPGLVRSAKGVDRFYLPRFLDGGDVTFVEFEAEMSGVLELLRRLVRRRG